MRYKFGKWGARLGTRLGQKAFFKTIGPDITRKVTAYPKAPKKLDPLRDWYRYKAKITTTMKGEPRFGPYKGKWRPISKPVITKEVGRAFSPKHTYPTVHADGSVTWRTAGELYTAPDKMSGAVLILATYKNGN